MTRQQLFILLGLGFVLLLNLLARGLRRWIKDNAPRGTAHEAPPVPARGRRPPPPVVEPRRAGEGPSTSRPAGPPDAAAHSPAAP
jgi:hypothetical protein